MRKFNKMTQAALAEAIGGGLRPQSVQKWEANKSFPDKDKWAAIEAEMIREG